MLEAGNGRPQQRHGAGDMRSGHGCAAGGRITTVAGIVARARVCSWSSDIGLNSIATVDSNRAATAEAGNRVGAGVQRADRIGRLIKRRRIDNCGTSRPGIACGDHHLDAGCSLRFHGGLQTVHCTTL
jgi:hypothetical protein